MKNFGVLIGSNRNSEWMLPHFFFNYRLHNHYPLAIADFGMSKKAKAWCEERMVCLDMTHLSSEEHLILNKLHPFFKKPYAFLASPFQRTLWLDIDCIVVGSLEHFESFILPATKMAMLKENIVMEVGIQLHFETESKIPMYNSGVVLFEPSDLLKLWAKKSLETSRFYRGDQEILSHLIYTHGLEMGKIERDDNWILSLGYKPRKKTKVLHFTGEFGKFLLYKTKKMFEKSTGTQLPDFTRIKFRLSNNLKEYMDKHGLRHYYRQ